LNNMDIAISDPVDLTTDVTGILPIANGGTNASGVPTNGQLLIGNATDYALSTLTAGSTKQSILNGAGTITLDIVENQVNIQSLLNAPVGAVIGTTDTQTLTNKTIDVTLNTVTGLVSADVGLGEVPNLKVNLASSLAPTANDDAFNGYDNGSTWLDIVTNKSYILLDSTTAAAVWKQTSNEAAAGGLTNDVTDITNSEYRLHQYTVTTYNLDLAVNGSSLNVTMNATTNWDKGFSLKGAGRPRYAIEWGAGIAQRKGVHWCLQVDDNSLITIDSFWTGFINIRARDMMAVTSAFQIAHDGIFTADDKILMGRFQSPNLARCSPSSTVMIRSGINTGNAVSIGDVIMAYINPTNLNFVIEWWRGGVKQATATNATLLTDMWNIMLSTEIVPYCGSFSNGKFKVLSSADIAVEGITIPANTTNYFD